MVKSLKQLQHLQRIAKQRKGKKTGKPSPMKGKKHSEKTKEKMRKARNKYKGDKHPSWKGGKIFIGGYVYIWKPTHPFAIKMGYICEHRLIMEQKLNRLLKPTEVIHHINHIKTDNRLKNLILFKSTGIHSIKEHVNKDLKTGKFISKI